MLRIHLLNLVDISSTLCFSVVVRENFHSENQIQAVYEVKKKKPTFEFEIVRFVFLCL